MREFITLEAVPVIDRLKAEIKSLKSQLKDEREASSKKIEDLQRKLRRAEKDRD